MTWAQLMSYRHSKFLMGASCGNQPVESVGLESNHWYVFTSKRRRRRRRGERERDSVLFVGREEAREDHCSLKTNEEPSRP